ncbi:uncharacterized protein LOC135200640 [Macrobrachium nipponense]|uniref:uncharacterized protein LOC135200640 n=1 Tax=Macrobrachium nipponense TaxID=159736 RepID=UPI0030C86DBC
MFQLYCILFVVLAFIEGDLLASVTDDILNFFCCQGVDSGLRVQDTLAAAVESFEPEIVKEPTSLLAPAFAIAIPELALLAGLTLVVCWKFRSHGRQVHELDGVLEATRHDGDDFRPESTLELEDSEAELATDLSDMSTRLEDLPDLEELEDTDDDEYPETDTSELSRLEDRLDLEEVDDSDDGLETDMSELSRLEDHLDLEDLEELDDSNDGLETDTSEWSIPEDRLDLEELNNSDDELETSRLEDCLEVENTEDLERLWKEAKEEIISLRNQLVEKDLMLRQKADQEAGMKSENENLLHQNEQILAQQRDLEDDLKRASYEREKMEKSNKELRDEAASLEKKWQEERRMRSLSQQKMAANERELEKEISHLEDLLAKKAIESEKAREKLATLEGQMTAIEDTVAELESQMTDVTADQVALRQKLELEEVENSRLEKLAADYEAQLQASQESAAAALRDRNCEIEETLANERRKNSILKSKVESLESEILELKDIEAAKEKELCDNKKEIKELKWLNASKAKKLSECDWIIRELQTQLARKNEEIETIGLENQELQRKVANCEKALAEHQRETLEPKDIHVSEERSLCEDQEMTEQKRLNALQAVKLSDSNWIIRDLQKQLARKNEEIEALRLENQELQRYAVDNEQVLAALQTEIFEKKRRKVAKEKERLLEKERAIEELKRLNASRADKVSDSDWIIQESQTQLDRKKEEIDAIGLENRELQMRNAVDDEQALAALRAEILEKKWHEVAKEKERFKKKREIEELKRLNASRADTTGSKNEEIDRLLHRNEINEEEVEQSSQEVEESIEDKGQLINWLMY